MTTEFKLVPVEPTLDMGWAYLDAARDAQPDKNFSFSIPGYRAMLAAAPTLPQPIYDEAKERELFEAWYGDVRLLSMDGKNRFMHDQDGTYWFIGTRKAWSGWLACAQSRAKSGEVGHE